MFVVAIGMCSGPYIRDNRLLARVRAQYSRVTHPPSSSVLASFSDVGLMAGGNGNHCDYLVGEIRESDDSSQQIKAHYSVFRFPMLDPQTSQWSAGQDVRVTVEFPGTSEDSGILRYDIPELVRKARAQQRKRTLYVVYVLDGGYEPNGDWRCH